MDLFDTDSFVRRPFIFVGVEGHASRRLQALAQAVDHLQGTLRISAADGFGAYVLPPIIDDVGEGLLQCLIESSWQQ
ncbi:hypothetical protein [Ancylobacter sp. G4_0304]|uniref:hypothetical protein n=1 Tax=Ancylobacter sp. G4_0304 TaxID=3114289 RepID=UPI0039C5D945